MPDPTTPSATQGTEGLDKGDNTWRALQAVSGIHPSSLERIYFYDHPGPAILARLALDGSVSVDHRSSGLLNSMGLTT